MEIQKYKAKIAGTNTEVIGYIIEMWTHSTLRSKTINEW